MQREIIHGVSPGSGAMVQPRAGINWIESSPPHLDSGWMEGGKQELVCGAGNGWLPGLGLKSLSCSGHHMAARALLALPALCPCGEL